MSDIQGRLASLPPDRARLLARLLKERGLSPSASAIPRRVAGRTRFPLSFAQQQLWFFDRLEPESALFNISRAVRWRGPLDRGALQHALDALALRHEVLRTRFEEVDGKPEQVVTQRPSIAVEYADLRAVAPEEREAVAVERATAEGRRPFDLERGPLVRVGVLGFADDDHVIVFVTHHIVSDGWSSTLLVGELATLYRAAAARTEPRLAELPIQYADYALWQRETFAGDTLQLELNYWRQRLAGSGGLLELPLDRPRPAVQTYAGAHVKRALEPGLGNAVADLAARHNTTAFVVMLAAWATLLARYTGQTDVTVGTPYANRDREEVRGLIGYFVNAVPLRLDLGGRPTFAELIDRVRARAGEAFARGHVPFEQIVDALDLARDPSHPPVFQTAFALQNAAAGAGSFEVPDAALSLLSLESGSSKLDLTLSAYEGPGTYTFGLEYNTALFERATAERILGHYTQLLASLLADPRRPVAAAPYVAPAERQELLAWSQGAERAPGPGVLEMWRAQVAARPEATALECHGARLSYAELDQRSDRLATFLRGQGVAPEAIVGLCCGRAPELIVGLLGAWKAGAAWVVLEERYPDERLRFVLDDAGVQCVLSVAGMVARLVHVVGETRVVLLDAEWDEIAASGDAAPCVEHRPDALAYVVYTSGSSGEPKGVMVRQGALANHAREIVAAYGLDPSQRRLQVVAPGFDAFGEEVIPLLCSGGTLVLGHDVAELDPAALMDVCRRESITAMHIPPSYWHALVDDLAQRGAAAADELRLVVVGAESPSAARLSQWAGQARPGSRWINAYGPAEATITATAWEAPLGEASRLASLARVPIGRPIGNVRTYLLDEEFDPVPVGVVGELYIGGAGLARGYVGRADLTAERFVPDVFGGEGGRLYRTGDLARFLSDGNLEFLGRRDHQVKVRGYRIELGEIEAVLREHGGVREAVVEAREDVPGEKRLVGYVVPREAGRGPSASELRAHVKERLPEYMVPSAWVELEELPRTAHGKLDRKALPVPATAGVERRGYEEPRTEVERTLCRIWEEVLRVPRVGVRDNFFELGGDSILSIQIVSRARAEGLQLVVKQLFQRQTVAELAEVAEPVGAAEGVEAGVVTGRVELTPIQRWFFEQEWAEPWHFNQSVLLESCESVSEAGLRAVVSELLKHHDALRTCYRRVDGEWEQEIVETAGEAVVVENVADSSELERRCAEWQTRFDLERGPLLRVVLFRMSGQRDRVLLVAHHLVVDGVSWRVLLEDVERGYARWSRGEALELGAKTASFKRWSERLKEHAASEAVQAQWEYWERQCAHGEGAVPGFEAEEAGADGVGVVSVRLDEDATRALLSEVPGVYGTRINDVLLLGLVEAAGVETEAGAGRGVRVELEGHGREESVGLDASRTVGWFTTQYPLWLEVEAGADIGSKLKAVKEQVRQVPEAGLGYGLLKYWGGDEERARRLEPGRRGISFNYLGQLDAVLPSDGLFQPARESRGPSRSTAGRTPYDLAVTGQVLGGRLQLSCAFRRRLYSDARVERIAARYADALRAVVAHCRQADAGGYTPSDFPLAGLDQARLDALFTGRRDIEDVYPLSPMQQGLLFHHLLDPGAGAYVLQISWSMTGLDESAFAAAWRRVIERHAILRTSLLWEGLAEPLQVVRKSVDLPLLRADWSARTPDEQREALATLMRHTREEGFAMSEAPLMRLHLLRLDEHTQRCVWAFHHLLMDGWSGAALAREVLSLYAEQVTGQPARLAAPFVYRDYIAWLRARDEAAGERFWRHELAGFATPTPLPLERDLPARGAELGERFGTQRRFFPAALSERVHAFTRAQRVTLNTLFQGAWALVLAGCSGESDVLFGATVAGRPAELPGIEDAVGLFINTIPVRVSVEPELSVLDWLRALQERQARTREWEHSSLMQVQAWSDVPRGHPLFESLLVSERVMGSGGPRSSEQAGSGLTDPLAQEHTHYPLTVEVAPQETILLRIGYERRRFAEEAVGRLARYVERLVEVMVADPARPLGAVRMLDQGEEAALLVERNRTRADYPAEKCFHELFEARVAATPHATAIAAPDGVLTYAELNRRANRVAHALREQGAGPESVVAVLAPRGQRFLSAVLGAFKSGAAYLPLETSLPPRRIAHILERSRSLCLLVSRDTRPYAERALAEASDAAPAPTVRDIEELIDGGGPDVNPDLRFGPSHLAYVIYTSGSTGAPKGAMLQHSGMINHLYAKVRDLSLCASDVVAETAAHTFDISVWQYLSALLVGGAVRVYDEAAAHDPALLWRGVVADGVTILEVVPSLLPGLLHEATDPAEMPLRWLLATGEALPPDLASRWLERFARVGLMNAYGPTECSDDVTHCVVSASTAGAAVRVPIGRPLANTRIYILDRELRPVPDGAPGELCVAGVGVGRGYLGDPARTAAAFVPDPFDPAGGRLYLTGDLARWLPGGEIDFIRRKDHQVKVRGYRIELGEIESALRSHAGVEEAHVLVDADAPGGRLLAYVVGSTAPAELRTFLRGWMPEYMVPQAIVPVDALPRLSSGKIDRRALLALADGAVAVPASVPPRTAVEKALAEMWSEVLRGVRPGAFDNFFDLGGQSLSATQLASRIREAFDVEFSLRTVFDRPTVAALAEALVSDEGQRERVEQTAQLLVQVATLSEAELDALVEPDQH